MVLIFDSLLWIVPFRSSLLYLHSASNNWFSPAVSAYSCFWDEIHSKLSLWMDSLRSHLPINMKYILIETENCDCSYVVLKRQTDEPLFFSRVHSYRLKKWLNYVAFAVIFAHIMHAWWMNSLSDATAPHVCYNFNFVMMFDACSSQNQQQHIDIPSCRFSEFLSMFAYNICVHSNGECNDVTCEYANRQITLRLQHIVRFKWLASAAMACQYEYIWWFQQRRRILHFVWRIRGFRAKYVAHLWRGK